MPFDPKLVEQAEAPLTDSGDLQLPDDLQELAAQLGDDAKYLAKVFPARSPQSESIGLLSAVEKVGVKDAASPAAFHTHLRRTSRRLLRAVALVGAGAALVAAGLLAWRFAGGAEERPAPFVSAQPPAVTTTTESEGRSRDRRPALAHLVSGWSERFGIESDYETLGNDGSRFAPEVEANLYRLAQEALSNVRRYARASRVTVSLKCLDRRLECMVLDDGLGFDTTTLTQGDGETGMGLPVIRNRIEALVLLGAMAVLCALPAVAAREWDGDYAKISLTGMVKPGRTSSPSRVCRFESSRSNGSWSASARPTGRRTRRRSSANGPSRPPWCCRLPFPRRPRALHRVSPSLQRSAAGR